MKRNNPLDDLFKAQSEPILVFMKVSVENDPYEHTTTDTQLNSLPIEALVVDLVASQVVWKLPSITTSSAKELIIQIKHLGLIELSEKIEIDGVTYNGWVVNGKLQIRVEQNYLRIYVYNKKDD